MLVLSMSSSFCHTWFCPFPVQSQGPKVATKRHKKTRKERIFFANCCAFLWQFLFRPLPRSTLPTYASCFTFHSPLRRGHRHWRRIRRKCPQPIIRRWIFSIIYFVGADASQNETGLAGLFVAHRAASDDVVWDKWQIFGNQFFESVGIVAIRQSKAFQRARDDRLVQGGLCKNNKFRGGTIFVPLKLPQ